MLIHQSDIDVNNQLYYGFIIRAVLLVESSFKRVPQVTESHKGSINFETKAAVKDNNLNVELKFDYVAPETNPEVQVSIKMVGLFVKPDVDVVDREKENEFIGAHSIDLIYPYVRNHVSDLFLKASLAPITLPYINFLERYRESVASADLNQH